MYEIYALKIAEREVESPEIFSHTDYGKRVMVDYYFCCLKSNSHTILLDTGISSDELKARKITGTPTREELLSRIGIRLDAVDTVIVSHLHGDHFADPRIYPKAVFYVQRREVEFWSGEIQSFQAIISPPFLQGKPLADILTFQKLNMEGRVRFLDGDSEIYPGVRTLAWGAHTPGHQLVAVQTVRGAVLLCSDFCDMYRNLEQKIPVGRFTNLIEWLSGVERIERMALPKDSIIPGHDPLVLSRFTKVANNIVKIA